MEVLGSDIYSSYEIIVWLPEDGTNDYDTIITEQKTLWRGKIILINGQITLEGDFPDNIYTLSTGYEGQDLLQIINWTLEVNHRAGMTSETLIEVVMRSDGGVDDSELLETVMEETDENEDVEITLYPVPTEANLTINYTSELAGYTTVSLYDSKGIHLVDIHSGNLEIDDHVFYQTMSGVGLNDDEIYYIFISVGSKVYVKQGIMN